MFKELSMAALKSMSLEIGESKHTKITITKISDLMGIDSMIRVCLTFEDDRIESFWIDADGLINEIYEKYKHYISIDQYASKIREIVIPVDTEKKQLITLFFKDKDENGLFRGGMFSCDLLKLMQSNWDATTNRTSDSNQ